MRTIISKLPRYQKFRKGRYSIEIGCPWLTYGAIITLERISMANFNVLEVGSGSSTVFFGRRCTTVKSYENNPVWAEKLYPLLPSMPNVTLICKPTPELIEIIKKEPDEFYDIGLMDIDGPRDRLALAELSVPKIKKGGYLVMDNYMFRNIARFNYSGWDVFNFDDLNYHGRGTRICIKL